MTWISFYSIRMAVFGSFVDLLAFIEAYLKGEASVSRTQVRVSNGRDNFLSEAYMYQLSLRTNYLSANVGTQWDTCHSYAQCTR